MSYLSSAIFPKTTNRTAGHTPYPTFLLPEKRKLDYSSTGKTVRKVSRKKLLSTVEMSNANKLFYTILPDGIASFFATRGHPEGPNGFMQPALNAISEGLSGSTTRHNDLLKRINVASVLPLVDVRTGNPRQFFYANGTKSMNIRSLVYIFDAVGDCNETNLDGVCTNLCS